MSKSTASSSSNTIISKPSGLHNFKVVVAWLLVSCLVWIGLIALIGPKYVKDKAIIDTRLEALLPASAVNYTDSNQYMDRLGREIIFMVSFDGSSKQNMEFAEQLASLVLEFTSKISSQDKESLFNREGLALNEATSKFIWEHRYAFMPPSVVSSDAKNPGEAQERLKSYVLEALYNPFGGITATELEHDPFMTMRNVAMSIAPDFTLSPRGFLVKTSADKSKHLLVRLNLSRKALGAEANKLLAEAKKWRENCPQGFDCSYTGPLFFAQTSQNASTDDLTRIGIASTFVLILLFLLVFRSVKELVLTLMLLGGALISGILLELAVFKSIHAVALGMGGTICGICADYAIHVFMHKAQGQSVSALKSTLKMPLFWSLLSSVLAYVVLYLTGLTVLKQLALLTIGALIYAWASVYFIFTKIDTIGPCSLVVGQYFTKSLLVVSYKLRLGLSIVVGVFGLYTFYTTMPDDDCAKMQERNSILTKMNKHVTKTLGGGAHTAYYLILGQDREEALLNCVTLSSHPKLQSTFLPCRLLPPKEVQVARYELYSSLFPIIQETLATEEVYVNSQGIALDKPSFFVPEDFPGDVASLVGAKSVLVRVTAGTEIEEVLKSYPFVQKFDQRAAWSQALGQMRDALTSIFPWTILGVAVLGFIYLRHRFVKNLIIPLLCGMGAGCLGVFFGAAGYFSLFTVLSLFMLIGLGADYCIFLAKDEVTCDRGRSMAGVLLAFATTESAFGALAFSETAVISSFGFVLACGLPAIIFAVPIRKTLDGAKS